MSRQQRRQIEREINNLSPAAYNQIRSAAMIKGIEEALATVKKALHAEYGFGAKRLARLEKAIHDILLEEEANEKP